MNVPLRLRRAPALILGCRESGWRCFLAAVLTGESMRVDDLCGLVACTAARAVARTHTAESLEPSHPSSTMERIGGRGRVGRPIVHVLRSDGC